METRISKKKFEKSTEPKNIANFFFNCRFLIAFLFVTIVVVLNLNGSSIGMWDDYAAQRDDGKTSDVIFGKNRGIRSDEWMVQTPFYLSQTETGYPVVNDSFSPDGQNMIIAYNSPVKDITVLGKPFNWGFFLLGKERGLSFYWAFKLAVMVLLGIEMSLILTKKNRLLSTFSGFAIALAPAVQWWFMQHVGDLIFFTLGLMVAFYHYFVNHDQKLKRFLLAILIVICTIGFVLVIYPAHQVMLAYLILFWLVGILLVNRKNIHWDLQDLILIVGGLLIAGFVLTHFYLISKDAIKATMNTIYPGKRVELGGNTPVADLFLYLTNWRLPFQDINFMNNSEVAFFYNLFPVVILAAPFIWMKKQFTDRRYLGLILIFYCLFSLGWMFIGLPESLAKISLLSYVPNTRCLLTFSFAALLSTIWFIGLLWEKNFLPVILKVLLAAVMPVLAFWAIRNSNMQTYFSENMIMAMVIALSIFMIILTFSRKIFFYLMASALVVISGAFVNPVVHGTGAITEKSLAKAIKKIDKKDPEQLWLSEGSLYNFTPALGVHSFNTVRFYPDLKTWRKIDPAGTHEEYYNRYAHIHAYVTAEETNYQLLNADAFLVNLNFNKIDELKIKYVVSDRPLQDYNHLNNLQFSPVYGPDNDGNTIFQISKNPKQAVVQPEPQISANNQLTN